MKDINHVPGPLEDEISDLIATINEMEEDINEMQVTITDLLWALKSVAEITSDQIDYQCIEDVWQMISEVCRAAIAKARGE